MFIWLFLLDEYLDLFIVAFISELVLAKLLEIKLRR